MASIVSSGCSSSLEGRWMSRFDTFTLPCFPQELDAYSVSQALSWFSYDQQSFSSLTLLAFSFSVSCQVAVAVSFIKLFLDLKSCTLALCSFSLFVQGLTICLWSKLLTLGVFVFWEFRSYGAFSGVRFQTGEGALVVRDLLFFFRRDSRSQSWVETSF